MPHIRVHSGVLELLLDRFGGGRLGTRRRTCQFALALRSGIMPVPLRPPPRWSSAVAGSALGCFPFGRAKADDVAVEVDIGAFVLPPHSVSCGE